MYAVALCLVVQEERNRVTRWRKCFVMWCVVEGCSRVLFLLLADGFCSSCPRDLILSQGSYESRSVNLKYSNCMFESLMYASRQTNLTVDPDASSVGAWRSYRVFKPIHLWSGTHLHAVNSASMMNPQYIHKTFINLQTHLKSPQTPQARS